METTRRERVQTIVLLARASGFDHQSRREGTSESGFRKMCAHCPMLGGVSPPFILFPLLCEGDVSRGLCAVSTLTSATRSLLPPKPTNRLQSCLRVHDHGEASLRLPIQRRSQAKQSRSHHPHPKATHVQQGSKIGNRHAHQKGPNLSRNVVTVRHGRQRRGVGEINQRSDEKRR